MQWHPIFAHLLRPLVQDYYEVQTTVPVGDLPREADIVLLRRTTAVPPPFVGLWRHLTTWNVLELKGASVDPRLRDLDLLLELGLGIDRRLNEERRRQQQANLERAEVSFWYLANHLGRRFLAEAEELLGRPPAALGPGLWRCQHLGRVLFLVSSDTLPVDAESVPLHLVSREPEETELAVARVVLAQPGYWERYSAWLAFLHPATWEEVQRMAETTGIAPNLDFGPLIKLVGLKPILAGVGVKQLVEEVGCKRLAEEVGVKRLAEAVGVKRLVEEVGLKRVLEEVGVKRVLEEVGVKRVLEEVGVKRVLEEVGPQPILAEMGLDWLVSQLTPEQLQDLKQRLQ